MSTTSPPSTETKDDSSEGVILVMGVTGAGKSYFLNQLQNHSVKEGHSLFAGKSNSARTEEATLDSAN